MHWQKCNQCKNRSQKPVYWFELWISVLYFTSFALNGLTLYLIQKPAIWNAQQIKWLVSLWKTTLGWNGFVKLLYWVLLILLSVKIKLSLPVLSNGLTSKIGLAKQWRASVLYFTKNKGMKLSIVLSCKKKKLYWVCFNVSINI